MPWGRTHSGSAAIEATMDHRFHRQICYGRAAWGGRAVFCGLSCEKFALLHPIQHNVFQVRAKVVSARCGKHHFAQTPERGQGGGGRPAAMNYCKHKAADSNNRYCLW